jgi:hypothetical protein
VDPPGVEHHCIYVLGHAVYIVRAQVLGANMVQPKVLLITKPIHHGFPELPSAAAIQIHAEQDALPTSAFKAWHDVRPVVFNRAIRHYYERHCHKYTQSWLSTRIDGDFGAMIPTGPYCTCINHHNNRPVPIRSWVFRIKQTVMACDLIGVARVC